MNTSRRSRRALAAGALVATALVGCPNHVGPTPDGEAGVLTDGASTEDRPSTLPPLTTGHLDLLLEIDNSGSMVTAARARVLPWHQVRAHVRGHEDGSDIDDEYGGALA